MASRHEAAVLSPERKSLAVAIAARAIHTTRIEAVKRALEAAKEAVQAGRREHKRAALAVEMAKIHAAGVAASGDSDGELSVRQARDTHVDAGGRLDAARAAVKSLGVELRTLGDSLTFDTSAPP